jgi:hypothetical protein
MSENCSIIPAASRTRRAAATAIGSAKRAAGGRRAALPRHAARRIQLGGRAAAADALDRRDVGVVTAVADLDAALGAVSSGAAGWFSRRAT